MCSGIDGAAGKQGRGFRALAVWIPDERTGNIAAGHGFEKSPGSKRGFGKLMEGKAGFKTHCTTARAVGTYLYLWRCWSGPARQRRGIDGAGGGDGSC
jgi:hypothetical protein